jgi:CRP-like cAMP-binding protein
VNLQAGDVLHEPFQPIEYIYFFEGGLSSEIVTDAEGEKIEVGCIGREGFSGFPVVLGVPSSPHRAFMEIGGPAKRVAASEILRLMRASPDLAGLLLRSIHVFMIQVASTALADGRYEIHQRLARWLLMAHDRIGSDDIALTHDFLALMLGVRRAGVTNAIHLLEGDHLIRAERGLITIRDRIRLEKLAGGCYGAPEAEFRRVILGKDQS